MSKETVGPQSKFSINVLEEKNGFHSVTTLGPKMRKGDFKVTQLIEKDVDIFGLTEYVSPRGELTREICVTVLAPDHGY